MERSRCARVDRLDEGLRHGTCFRSSARDGLLRKRPSRVPFFSPKLRAPIRAARVGVFHCTERWRELEILAHCNLERYFLLSET